MKIVAISDIHGNLIDLPPCDVVCICGDILPLDVQRNIIRSMAWLAGPFQKWALELPCEKVIMIWGNHDFIGERLKKYGTKDTQEIGWVSGMASYDIQKTLFQVDYSDKINILCDDMLEYNGVNFYGTSWCPELRDWAFYGDEIDLINYFSKIPGETDILLTHCPPKYGQQGMVLDLNNWNFGKNYGSKELQDYVIKNLTDKSSTTYILSGHIHSGNHSEEHYKNIIYRNVSILNEDYEFNYQPYIFEINKEK